MPKKTIPESEHKEKYSISKILREKNKSNDIFEIMLNALTIEEIISLKFELLTRTVGTNIYGIPLWRSLGSIIKDSLLRYAIYSNSSKKKASRFLGMEKNYFNKLLSKYDTKEFFEKIWKEDKGE